jgi:hypothetical protein
MPLRKIARLANDEPTCVRFDRHISKSTVQQLLLAGVMKFDDAKRKENSGPTRLEAAYDAILFCALALFAAAGYKVTANRGHHKIALEGLAGELELSEAIHDEMELILEVRNTKYTGFINVHASDLSLALELAQKILNKSESWLMTHRPLLLRR